MKRHYFYLFAVSFSVCMIFALVTDHRWEDWYITYCASKNLAIGNGLTFTPGERVHSFTSPINTLVPALFAYIFQSNPDEFAIWLYRILNSIVIGFCSILIFKISDKLYLLNISRYVFIGLFLTNILIIDNSINGMETPYMMFFLLLLIYNLSKNEESQISIFVFSFTGLMYTRPDGFVYAFFLIGAYSIFYFDRKTYFHFLKNICLAGLVSILLYAPWTVTTWLYYGTPIPNTIAAKSNLKVYEPLQLLVDFVKLPYCLISGKSIAHQFFMPGYAYFGGWYKLGLPGRLVSTVAALAFVIPFFPRMARAISLSVFLGIFYLEYVSGQGGMPWYLPNLTIQIIIIFALLFNYFYLKFHYRIIYVSGVLFVMYSFIILFLGGYEMKIQQQVIEYGHRKKIGEWLKANSTSEKSTVFMECLGYIGYYSQLKTYDFPGMSSLEVVKTLKEVKGTEKVNFAYVIGKLRPDWVVLRPIEVEIAQKDAPGLLQSDYKLAKIFDVKEKIPANWYLLGKEYLYFDAVFYVYRKSE